MHHRFKIQPSEQYHFNDDNYLGTAYRENIRKRKAKAKNEPYEQNVSKSQ